MRVAGWATCALMALALAGCSNASKSKDSTDGKTYTPAAKSKQAVGGGKSSNETSVTPRPDDANGQNPTKGQVVLNPGSPTPPTADAKKPH